MGDKGKVILVVEKVHHRNERLDQWIAKQPDVGGIREVDENGLRYIVDLRTKEKKQLQAPGYQPKEKVEHGSLDVPVKDSSEFPDIIMVGHYALYKSALRWAQERLLRDFEDASVRYVVVDNVGPLELRHDAGLEPAVSKMFAERHKHPEKRLVVLVREAAVEAFKRKYNLSDTDLVDFAALSID